jgi:hypothetical protein
MRSKENQAKMDQAYLDTMNAMSPVLYFAWGYLSNAIQSGRHSCAGLSAIEAGMTKALKERGYPV